MRDVNIRKAQADVGLILLTTLIILILIIAAVVYQQHQTSVNTPQKTLTASPISLDWGNLTRYSHPTRTVNLTNTSPYNMTLNMTSTCKIGTVTWNAENQTLPANTTQTVTFSIRTYWNATEGPFRFDITIYGREVS